MHNRTTSPNAIKNYNELSTVANLMQTILAPVLTTYSHLLKEPCWYILYSLIKIRMEETFLHSAMPMSEEKKMIHRINLHFDNQIHFVPFTHSLLVFFPSQGQGLVYLIYTDFFFYLLCQKHYGSASRTRDQSVKAMCIYVHAQKLR